MAFSSNQQLDSIVSFRNSQGEKATGTVRGVSRQSVSLEVYNPYSVAQMSEMLSSLVIRRQGRVVYEGSAVVTSLINTGIYLVISVTLTDPWQDLNALEDDQSIQTEISRFLTDLQVYKKIDPGFLVAITNMRNKLSELSRWLEQIDMMHPDADKDGQNELIDRIKEPLITELYGDLVAFEKEAKQVSPEVVEIHRAFAQRDLHPLILRSPYVHRVYTKPLGYAGDFEMVNMMLRSPHEGPSTYYKLINNLFLNSGPVVAHRNRIKILVDVLQEKVEEAYKNGTSLKVLNLGCGPAVEIQRLMTRCKMDSRIEFTLLDFSQPTLDNTKEQIDAISRREGSSPSIIYEHKSVDQILRQSARIKAEDSNKYDFIYCAGLFDYFSDKACSRVLKLFYSLIKPGCQVLSTNVHENNPVIAAMEYLAEWHLVYRNEETMKALSPPGIDSKVYGDETGVNIFLEFWKPKQDG